MLNDKMQTNFYYNKTKNVQRFIVNFYTIYKLFITYNLMFIKYYYKL